MKVSEYIQLLRAGYTKAEIDAIVAEEKNPPPPPDPEPEQPDPEPDQQDPDPESAPAWATALASSIEHLQQTVQGMNRSKLEQPDEDPLGDVDKALAAYLKGPEKR